MFSSNEVGDQKKKLRDLGGISELNINEEFVIEIGAKSQIRRTRKQ